MKISFIRSCLVLFIPVLFLFGCGESTTTSDAAKTGVRVDAWMVGLIDAGEEVVTEIDVEQLTCDLGPPVELEVFTEAYGVIETEQVPLSNLGNLPFLYITGFCVDYIPQLSPDGINGLVMPPPLTSWCTNETILLPVPGETEVTISVVPINTKLEFVNKGGLAIDVGIYEIRVTFYGESEVGVEFEIGVSRDAHFGPWNRC